ncbi:MAG: hypothetical protein ABSH51_14430 [Solirubrobacteraceae bacterium]
MAARLVVVCPAAAAVVVVDDDVAPLPQPASTTANVSAATARPRFGGFGLDW